MQDCDNISPYLLGAGLTELDRALKMLQPESVSIMHLGVEEWIEFTHSFAQHIHYYADDVETSSGNWKDFYEKALALKDEIKDYDAGEIPPHLTLLIAFLNLLDYSKTSLNGITKRHLDFYYREVLQIKNRAFIPDQVYTIFELNKNIEEFLIEKGTLLNGGKDSEGTLRHYAVEENTVINTSKITNYQTIYADDKGVYKNETEDITEIDGLYPFGSPTDEEADYGFSVSSNTLFLKEGARKIKIKITCENQISALWGNTVKVFFSTNKGWVEKTNILTSTDPFFSESLSNKEYVWRFALGEDDEEIIAPSSDLHGRDGNEPVVKFLFTGVSGYDAFQAWRKINLKEIKIDTETVYSESLKVKTDQNFVDTKNEFLPFGAVPKKGSVLKVHSDELVGKKVTSADVSIQWKDVPDLKKQYKGYYRQYYTNDFTQSSFTDGTSIVTTSNGSDRFKVKLGLSDDTPVALFAPSNNKFSISSLGAKYHPENSNDYPIRLTLLEDFAHKEYGIITTLAVKLKYRLPQPPYTPLAEGITLTARTTASLSATQTDIQLSWEFPFGYKKFSALQKEFLPPIESNTGELYLGIEKEKQLQLFQFLITLEEGTENPDRVSVTTIEDIQWYYLSDDKWIKLSSLEILKNETDNFLKTGLFQFKIPVYNQKNNVLPSDKLWIKARLENHYDTVSKIQGFHAQAVRATFQEQGNSLEHLSDGIEAETISKLINRKGQIKKVIQPYSSFEGKSYENDAQYYTRVSERLRHKNRAVSTWDCNHILLEEFAFVHKIKTINHSLKNDYIQPGEVLIVAVPSMQNQKVYNLLQPKISQAKLNLLADFINERNSLHVTAQVVSPIYLPVKIMTDIKYHEGYDSSYYEKVLRDDITAYLAPWTTQGENALQFGGQIFYSQVVYFIEQLPYVDYLKNLRIVVKGGATKNVLPKDPMTIITSVPAHEHDFQTIKQSVCTL